MTEMCLTTRMTGEDARKKYGSEGIGWKIFEEKRGRLVSLYKDRHTFHRRAWNQSRPRRIHVLMPNRVGNGGGRTYTTGFHLFASQYFADSYAKRLYPAWLLVKPKVIIVRVRWRGLLTAGYQDGYPVIVAREVKLCP